MAILRGKPPTMWFRGLTCDSLSNCKLMGGKLNLIKFTAIAKRGQRAAGQRLFHQIKEPVCHCLAGWKPSGATAHRRHQLPTPLPRVTGIYSS